MSNNYFQFKQFNIEQQNCSMKVCTDACLLGAFAAKGISQQGSEEARVLDIGTGTGLLSLMIAQKNNSIIEAVEIEAAACSQAKQNFEDSPWGDRLNIFNTDIAAVRPGKKYHHIISNPPFYEDDLLSNNENKNRAKHDLSLTLKDLLKNVNELLKEGGIFWVLLPFHRLGYFENEASEIGLCSIQKMLVRQTNSHPYFRGILALSKNKNSLIFSELQIKEATGVYTEGFVDLLKEYYLFL